MIVELIVGTGCHAFSTYYFKAFPNANDDFDS